MPVPDDIYAISARVNNFMAREDLGLTPAGKILSNTFSLFLKDLYSFSDTLPEPYKTQLWNIAYDRENLPCYIIRLCTPKPNPEAHLYGAELPEYDE